MYYAALVVALLLAATPASLLAQVSDDVLRERIQAAQEDPTTDNLIRATAAARLLGDYEQAGTLLQQAAEAVQQAQNAVLANRILVELAFGGGVNGAQRAFREARSQYRMAPQVIGAWVNGYPVLLVGGEFDELIEQFSSDAEDPRFRCTCYAQKAWMHRVAGRMDQSRMYWDSLVTVWENNPPQTNNPDIQAQLARNYARAGRPTDARRALEEAMSMDISDDAIAGVRRRWAQTYAELGDVESAVEHLEYLLSASTLVTLHSLETRVTWAPIREHSAFQALLNRHR